MKAVVQRVARSTVRVDDRTIGAISKGLLVLLGVAREDTEQESRYLADKIVNLRIFEDEKGKMNRSLCDVGGAMLVVSQFTLLGDCRKGRRPSFIQAAPPDHADALYRHFVQCVQEAGIETATGQFQAMMQVGLINDGPVTLILERTADKG